MHYIIAAALSLATPQHSTMPQKPILGRHGVGLVTAYCSRCSPLPDANGHRLRTGTVAADTRHYYGTPKPGALHTGRTRHGHTWWAYWAIGDRITFGSPINATLVVMDTGGAIRGPDRFDLCKGTVSHCRCGMWGVRRVEYKAVIDHD